jgi:chromatin segregation and condensation protein Rec8/ScpA/Scc1 (kleisin family)
MISRITSALEREARISFGRIRATCAGPQDTAVAFLALLTLMRRQAVNATQSELFGPIELARGMSTLHASLQPAPPERNGTNGDDRR